MMKFLQLGPHGLNGAESKAFLAIPMSGLAYFYSSDLLLYLALQLSIYARPPHVTSSEALHTVNARVALMDFICTELCRHNDSCSPEQTAIFYAELLLPSGERTFLVPLGVLPALHHRIFASFVSLVVHSRMWAAVTRDELSRSISSTISAGCGVSSLEVGAGRWLSPSAFANRSPCL